LTRGAYQGLAFALKDLLEREALALGQLHDLGARDLKQPAVHRVRYCLALHRGVNDHALELGGPAPRAGGAGQPLRQCAS
jgi:hypothetical protein